MRENQILFKRNVRLSISDNFTNKTKSWSDLLVKFRITYTLEADSNKATIEIYNLSRKSRDLLDSLFDENKNVRAVVILEVGYGPIRAFENFGLDTLFIGDIETAKSKKDGPDWITEITAGDSDKDLKLPFSRTYIKKDPSFTSPNYRQIIKDVFKSIGFIVDQTSLSFIKTTPIPRSISIEGTVKDVTNTILEGFNLEWAIYKRKVQILEKGKTNNSEVIQLRKDTGLLDEPIKTDKGLNIKALIRPNFIPGTQIRIRSDKFDGFYKIERVTFDGDSRGPNWFADMECSFVTPLTIPGTVTVTA